MSEDALQPGARLCGWTLEVLLQATPRIATWRVRAGDRVGILKHFGEPLDAAARRSIQRGFRRAQGIRVAGVVPPEHLQATDHGLVVVRPRVDGTPLFDSIRERRGEEQVARAVELGCELFRVLARLHRCGLVHGHLSPGNIWVMADGTIQLTDLGTSEALVRSSIQDLPGRLPPTAPEVAAGWGPRPATDVHAAGALLYIALSAAASDRTDRTTPWGPGATEALPGLCLRRRDVPPHLSWLLSQAAELDPAQRPTAADLASAMASDRVWTTPAPLPPAPRRVGQAGAAEQALRHFSRPGPRLVVLAGPAGCGRGRLADTLLRHALRSHRPPLRVRADRAETGSLLIGTLRRLVGVHQHAARRRRLLRDHGQSLGTLWPELRTESTGAGEGLDARTIIDAAVEVTHRALADRPVMLVFERLEDADPLSLRFVHSLLGTETDLWAVATVDDRWQSEELRRMRSRLSDRAAVLDVTLRDLTPDEAERVVDLITRGIPERPQGVPVAAASPARVTERGHQLLAAWLGVPWPEPDATATVFALAEELPEAALQALDLDPGAAVDRGLAVVDRPGWLRRSHSGIEALGARGLARRDKLADRLADALTETGASRAAIARVRLFGTRPARSACVRAALEAHSAGHAAATRRWLHVVDRLPRDRSQPDYAALRAPLARVRAEVAHIGLETPVRTDLLQQAFRRAQRPHEQADLAALHGWVAAIDADPARATALWLAGAADAAASVSVRAHCAFLALSHQLQAGELNSAEDARRALLRCSREPNLPRGAQRRIALGLADHALAERRPRVAAALLSEWLARPEAAPDPNAAVLLARAHHLAGEDAAACAHIDAVLDADSTHGPARVVQGWLALLRGDTHGALRAHRLLGEHADPWRLPLELRLAAARGEHHQLRDLLGRPAPSRRPDHHVVWLTAVLDGLRTIPEPGLRLARLGTARTLATETDHAELWLALAWHAIDDGDPDGARRFVERAGAAARASSQPVHAARARMLHAMLSGGTGWHAATRTAIQHTDARVRHDVGELSARLALQTGDATVAAQWIQYLSGEATRGPDHGLAARTTRVHRMIQAAGGEEPTGR